MINKIINLLVKYKELILYGIFGVLTTVVNFAVFWLFGKILGTDMYLVNNAVAWFAAVVFAYVTNKLFVFESKSFAPKVLIKEIGTFFSSRIMTFGIEEGGLWLLVNALNFNDLAVNVFGFEIGGQMIAKAIVGVTVIITNYFMTKFITFGKKKDKKKI